MRELYFKVEFHILELTHPKQAFLWCYTGKKPLFGVVCAGRQYI